LLKESCIHKLRSTKAPAQNPLLAYLEAGLDPIRADEEQVGGIIHKPMFERLILCEFAVADLTAANANVFYELGVRHAVRRASTLLLFAGNSRLPFDVAPLRAMPYPLTAGGIPDEVEETKAAITQKMREIKEGAGKAGPPTDSPIFQLVEGFPDIQRLKTDVFRNRVVYSEQIKRRLLDARREGVDCVRAVDQGLPPLNDLESGVVVDLFLSYRAVSAWTDMICLYERMSAPLAATALAQEQYAFALNRQAGKERKGGNKNEAERLSTQAESILRDLIASACRE
jgi:hypothetical protein